MELGQRVRVDMRKGLTRGYALNSWTRKVWKQRQWHRLHEVEGVVVGVRTYSEGHVSRDYEYGTEYRADKHFPVVLVAYDLRCNPVAFHPEDVHV